MHRLERLLRPETIAIIGGGFAANAVEQSRRMGFAGEIWPVHPTKPAIAGVRAYPSIADLPGVPDATFIGVNRHLTIDILRDLQARDAGGAICFASGFLEAEGDDSDARHLQEELLRAAGDMPIIGPNCYGLINYADGALLWPDQHGGQRLAAGERGVAIITQSSNIAINMTMQKRGLPIAYIMTAGNQAQTGLSEMALNLIEDDRVSALGLHIEGFDSVSGFETLAERARALGKPIVAMKVGRSEQARAATISHTASLAGSDAVSGAFLLRLGIARADSVPAFLETLKLLHAIGPLSGRRLSSMSCSGGEASLIADAAQGREVEFPSLSDADRARVKATLGPMVAVANPLDYHTFIWNDEAAMTRTFTAMLSGGFDLNLLVLDFPRRDRGSDADWQQVINAFEAALASCKAPGAVVASLAENLPEDWAVTLLQRGIVPFHGIDEALEAVASAAAIGEAWRSGPASPIVVPGTGPQMSNTLNEAEAKTRLSQSGLPVPSGCRAMSADEAVSAANSIGYPVVLKALGIAHKTEHDALCLGLSDEAGIITAANRLLPLGHSLFVERMITGSVAELIVGITRDPTFGPVMTIGSGGVYVELLQDSATLLLPTSREAIEQALHSLKLFPLLRGYRGRPLADLPATIDTIQRIACFATEHAAEIVELDINPLIICAEGKGAWIADALLVEDETAVHNTMGEDTCQMP